MFVLWCNGSTTVFGSVCLSSNLGRTTSLQSIIDKNPQNMQLCGFFVSLDKLFRKMVTQIRENIREIIIGRNKNDIAFFLIAVYSSNELCCNGFFFNDRNPQCIFYFGQCFQ